MSEKVTWEKIYEDFKLVYPNLSKKAIHYRPCGHMLIDVWFSDGQHMVYDYNLRLGHFVAK